MTGTLRCRCGHGGGRPHPEPLRPDVDPVVEQASDTHQLFRPAHVLLQELQHIGAAGDVFDECVGAAGLWTESDGACQAAWPFQSEGVHISAVSSGYRWRSPRR
jgi:hypothetical protein